MKKVKESRKVLGFIVSFEKILDEDLTKLNLIG